MSRLRSFIFPLFLGATICQAQLVPGGSFTAPAAVATQFRDELALTETQAAKLRDLSRVQAVALDRAMSAYLRAEAGLLDALNGEDLGARRSAFERRSRVAIDAEISRIQWEREVRAVLDPRQQDAWALLASRADLRVLVTAPWMQIVAPSQLRSSLEVPVDSGEVRIAVTPIHAEIYIGDVRHGVGRRFMRLPVGKYRLRLHAIGCTELSLPIEVVKGPPVVISHALSCGQ